MLENKTLPGRKGVTSGWLVFDTNPGVEKLWIVSSTEALAAFEGLAAGPVQNPGQSGVLRAELARYRTGAQRVQQTNRGIQLRGPPAGMAELLELRHR
jgi:hypothetical protein